MAKCCVDTNIFIAVAKILHFRRIEGKITNIEKGKKNSLYPILREINGLSGKELCTVQSVSEELDRGINPRAIGGSRRIQLIRKEFGHMYPLIKDLIFNKFQVFSATPESNKFIKEKREELFNFISPDDGKKKVIYTDFRQYKECSDNDINYIVTRNNKDFRYCRMIDPTLKPLRVIRPDKFFFGQAHESYTPHFTNSIAGRLLEAIYGDRYLPGPVTD